MPLKDKERFEYHEVDYDSEAEAERKFSITKYVTNKPHLVLDKDSLSLYSWVSIISKSKL